MSQIGKNIKKIRNVKGLSQQAFADLFQLTRGNISSYEEFRAEPRIEMVVRIANFFGIPLTDFIEKDLSVNELLHFNTGLVVEAEKLKTAQQLLKIPYIPSLYINEYIEQQGNDEFLMQMPSIVIPCNSKFKLIAIEVDNQETLPADSDYRNGDILIFEEVIKENVHRIVDRLGIILNHDNIQSGIYRQKGNKIVLALNEYVEYPFDLDSDSQYHVLRGAYTQGV